MGHRRVCTTCMALALTGLLVLVAEGPSSAAVTASTLIVPGEAIGPAQLGMSAVDLAAALGPSVPAGSGQLGFPRWGVTATLEQGVAVRLSTANPQLRTQRGAGVGTGLGEASHLVGDINLVLTVTGSDTVVTYPFQGIGFVLRAGRAAEVFVVKPLPAESHPVPARATPLAPLAAETTKSGASGAEVAIKSLAGTVDAATGLFRVTGRVINTGARPADSVTVTATFDRTTGDGTWKQQVLQQPLAPGADVAFSLQTLVGTAPVARYTIEVAAKSSGGASIAQETRTVPPSEYAAVARQNIQVKLELGAPEATLRGRGMVQVLVSIAGTGSIPEAWVKDVTVAIPFRGGSGEVHLAPGQTLTVLVPPLPQAGGGVLGPPAVVGEQPLALVASVVGQPEVTEVTLGAP